MTFTQMTDIWNGISSSFYLGQGHTVSQCSRLLEEGVPFSAEKTLENQFQQWSRKTDLNWKL